MIDAENRSAIIEAVDLFAAAFTKRTTPATVAAFATALSRTDGDSIRRAAKWWIENKLSMPSPADIVKVLKTKVRTEAAATDDAAPSFYCCSGCGMRVETKHIDIHPQWCEFEVRKRNGDAPPDQKEIQLRGLVTVRGSREDSQNLADFRAAKGARA